MKKTELSENYLDRIPVRNENIKWSVDENHIVTLEIENKGFFNTIAQKFFKKSRKSYIHLDRMGSFIWPLIDGNKNISELGKSVEAEFGSESHPLYERLSEYIRRLESYSFILFK